MKTAAELVTALDATPRDIENWVSRLTLSTRYQKTRQGSARLYSRENALELGFIAALVRGGATPARAAMFAETFLRDIRHSPRPLQEWFVFPAGKLESGTGSEKPDLDALAKQFGTVTLSFVRLREVVRRVDALFADARELVSVR